MTVSAMSPTQNWDGWFDTESLQLLSPQCENLSIPTGSASRSSSCCISWLPMFLTTHPPGWRRGQREESQMGYLWWERGRTGGQADLPPKPSVTKQPVLLDTFLPSPASVGPSVPGEMPTLQDHWMSHMQMPRASLGCVRRLVNEKVSEQTDFLLKSDTL